MVVLAATACGPSIHGAFSRSGYSSGYGYDIAYLPGSESPLPPEWQLDNFRRQNGILDIDETRSQVTKQTFLDDGSRSGPDDTFEVETYTYALRYEHRTNGGVIWTRNIPVPEKMRGKDLRVVMQNYLDEISGATYDTVRLGSTATRSSHVAVVEHRQVAIAVEQGPAMVGGKAAYAATIDIANVDQTQLSPGARTQRVQLVMLHGPKDEQVFTRDRSYRYLPVIVVAGYSNLPADFASGLDDFHGLLKRVSIAGTSGTAFDLVPVAPAQSAATPLPPR